MQVIEIGHLVGEYGLLSCQKRQGTLTATEDCVVLELERKQYEGLTKTNPALILVLSKICIVRIVELIEYQKNFMFTW